MAKTNLSGAAYVERGYGQVEPNHLSAQRTGQIYAQLPVNAEISKLENGQFVKYDYRNGEVNFTGAGEWMLVYNEVKVYRDGEYDADFAMLKENYAASVYSPVDGSTVNIAKVRDYSGVVTPADPYEVDSTTTPFTIEQFTNSPKMMPEGSTMVPRVFKTNVGDIFTTNCIKDAEVALGDILAPGTDGYLAITEAEDGMQWQVVKLYTLPDRQKAVKIMRIA